MVCIDLSAAWEHLTAVPRFRGGARGAETHSRGEAGAREGPLTERRYMLQPDNAVPIGHLHRQQDRTETHYWGVVGACEGLLRARRYVFQPDNAVPIGTFIDNMEDRELMDILPVLLAVEKVGDVRQARATRARHAIGLFQVICLLLKRTEAPAGVAVEKVDDVRQARAARACHAIGGSLDYFPPAERTEVPGGARRHGSLTGGALSIQPCRT